MRIIRVQHPFEDNPEVFETGNGLEWLTDLAEEFWPDQPYEVLVNGVLIAPLDRNSCRLAATDVIIFRPPVRGFVAGAWAAFSAAIGPTMTAIIVNVAIAFIGGMLIRLFTTPSKTDSSGISPWEAQLLQQDGAPIAHYYGRNRISGNIVASWRSVTPVPHAQDITWAVFFGLSSLPTNIYSTEQQLNLIVATGEGPVQGIVAGSVRFNEQALTNFPTATVLEKKGTINQTAFAGFTELPVEYNCGILVTIHGGPVTYTVPVNDMSVLAVNLSLTKGLNRIKSNGAHERGVQIKVELANTGTGVWHTLVFDWILASTLKPIYLQYRNTEMYVGGAPVDMTGWAGCDIRLTKVDTTVNHIDGDNTNAIFDELYLTSVHAIYSTAFVFPKQSLVFIQALPSAQLSGSLAFDCLQDGAIVNTYDGSTWTLQFSDNPAWVIFDMVTQPVITGDGSGGAPWAVSRYNGLDPAQVDLDSIWALAQHCDELVPGIGGTKRHVFNGGLISGGNLWQSLLEVCDGVRTAPVWDGQQLTFVIDEPGTPLQLFNVGNIIQDSFKQVYLSEDDRASEIEVKYRDETQDYKSDAPIVVVDETRETLSNVISVDLKYATRQAEAWRYGRYKMLQNKLLLRSIEFAVDTEALACGVGDLFYFQHDVIEPTSVLGGRALSATANTLTVNRDATLAGSLKVLVRVYNPTTGTWAFEDQAVTSAVGPLITLTGTWTIIPKRDDPWILGIASVYNKTYRVTKLQFQADKTTRVSALEYNVGVYAADTDTPILQATGTSSPLTSSNNVSLPTLDSLQSATPDGGLGTAITDTTIVGGVLWTSNSPSAGYVAWTAADTEYPILVTSHGIEYAVADGNSNKQYLYWDPASPALLKGTNTLADVASCGGALFEINVAGTATPISVGYDQIYNALSDLIGASKADSNFIVGNGIQWITESGNTARTSLGLGTGDSPTFDGIIVNTNTLHVDPVNHRVGVGTVTPTALWDVTQHIMLAGTVATVSTTALAGTNTKFTSEFGVGDIITVSGETPRYVSSVTSDVLLTVSIAFANTASGLSYTGSNASRFQVTGSGLVGVRTTTDSGYSMILLRSKVAVGPEVDTPANLCIAGDNTIDTSTPSVPILGFRVCRGPITAPTQVKSGDRMGSFVGNAYYTGGSSGYGGPAQFSFWCEEDQTDVARGASMQFRTTPIGSATAALAMYLSSAGNLGVGIASNAGVLERIHSSVNIRADGVFNCNGTAGVSDSSAGVPTALTVSGGIITAVTKNDWLDQSVKTGASPSFLKLSLGTTPPTTGLLLNGATTLATATPYGAVLNVTSSDSCDAQSYGMSLNLLAGYTGSTRTMLGLWVYQTAVTTRTGCNVANGYGWYISGNRCISGFMNGAGNNNVGVIGGASYATAYNFGVIGTANTAVNSSANLGVFGIARNTGTSPVNIGVMATLHNAASYPAMVSTALLADNSDSTDPIFLARDNSATVFSILDGGNVVATGRLASTNTNVTVANGATTFAIASNVVKVTGDAGGNTVATITGGLAGQVLTLIFVDTKVTITDDATKTANTVNLSAAFTSATNTVLTLVFDGTSWYEMHRSVNG